MLGTALGLLIATVGLHPCVAGAAEIHHLVQPGDTVYSLARRHGVSVSALASANALDDPHHIEAGTRLVLPGVQLAVSSQGAASERMQEPRPRARRVASSELGAARDARRSSNANIVLADASPAAASARSVSAARVASIQESPAARLSIPITLDQRQYPAVLAEITTRELLGVSPRGLAQSLSDVLDESVAARVSEMGTDLRPPADLAPYGIRARLNASLLTVEVELEPRARSTTDVSVSDLTGDLRGPVVLPERFAFGLTGALTGRSPMGGAGDTTGNVLVNGFANLGGLEGFNLDFGAWYDIGPDRFRRDRIVLFRDDRQRLVRYSAGDQTPILPRQAGVFDTLGFGVERNYQALQPRRNVRPAGRRSFVLERPSTVEVYVNGALANRFEAPAGALNLDDIPLASMANDVAIVVEDSLGRRELDSFSLAADITLLAPGLTEFSFSGGLLRDAFADRQYNYTSDLAAGGAVQRGLTDSLTLGGHALVSPDLANAGVSAAFSILRGVALVEAAGSNSSLNGAGYSLAMGYRGGPYFGAARGDLLTLRADYFSEDFATFSDMLNLSRLQWDAGANYNFNITERTSVSVGGSYVKRYGFSDPDANLFIGVGRRFNQVNVSITGRYARRSFGDDEAGVFISLSRAFGGRRFASASYDSINETARVEFRQTRGLDLPEIDYRIGASRRPGATEANAAFGYANSRFASEVRVDSTIEGSGGDFLGGRLQSGIAFVDGRAAVGRDPGRGFYMFSGHPTLDDARIDVRTGALGRTRGRSDRFGPAVVSVLQPYRDEELQVFTENAPIGYNLGEGRYTVLPGARTGTSIVIGDDAYRTAVASLLRHGEPIGLSYGVVVNLDTGEESVFFTNRAGRAAFNNLAPGRYRATITGVEESFSFTIARDDDAFVNLGVITVEQAR